MSNCAYHLGTMGLGLGFCLSKEIMNVKVFWKLQAGLYTQGKISTCVVLFSSETSTFLRRTLKHHNHSAEGNITFFFAKDVTWKNW